MRNCLTVRSLCSSPASFLFLKVKAAALVVFFATTCSASAQLVQNWDTKARERSQRLHSAAISALDKGLTAQAVTLLNQATAVDPQDAIALNTLGLALAREGKYDEGLDALQKAYKISHSGETLLNTGLVYYLQHDFAAAIKSWSKAIEVDSKFTPAYGNIGFAFIRAGDFDSAQDAFRKLIKTHPNSPAAYRGTALARYLSGEAGAALKAAEHARSLAPTSQPILLLLAKLEYLQGNADAGKSRVREWQAATPKKKSVPYSMTVIGVPVQHDFHWDVLGADNFDNGNFLLARTRLLPKEDGARRSYCSKGKMSVVLAQANAAAEAAPDDFFILRELALLDLSNGNYSKAADRFSRVLELCPNCKIDWLHLARAQSLAGKPSEASYAVKEYKRLLPNEKLSPIFSELATNQNTQEQQAPPAESRSPSQPLGTGF